MQYLGWALLALCSYSLVAPLVKLASEDVPSEVAVVIPNAILVVVALGVAVASDASLAEYAAHPSARYLYVAGAFLAVGIIAYYRALSLGPVSVVVPVFGMFLALSSVVGIAVLDEPLTLRKVLGIAFAVLAVYLTSVE